MAMTILGHHPESGCTIRVMEQPADGPTVAGAWNWELQDRRGTVVDQGTEPFNDNRAHRRDKARSRAKTNARRSAREKGLTPSGTHFVWTKEA